MHTYAAVRIVNTLIRMSARVKSNEIEETKQAISCMLPLTPPATAKIGGTSKAVVDK